MSHTSKVKEDIQTPNSLQTLISLSIMGEMVQIKVEGFSGPVDMLLELIDSQQLDVCALSLAEVTDQYWREIETREMDADTLSEFINIGSRLLYIKSCALLPGARQPAADLRGEIEQAAEELAALLQEHKRFKDAVDLFREIEEQGRRTFARTAPVRNIPLPAGLEGVTMNTLLDAVKEVLAKAPPDKASNGKNGSDETVLQIEAVTVTEKIAEISKALTTGRGRLAFRPLLAACHTRTEIVVLFLAVLELIKGGTLWAEQARAFGDIELIETAAEAAAPQA
jgi:segregation and condensation protein A